MMATIIGHTDVVGAASFNHGLSERWAEAIAASRIATLAGRSMNRRSVPGVQPGPRQGIP